MVIFMSAAPRIRMGIRDAIMGRLGAAPESKSEQRISHISYHQSPGLVSKVPALESHPYSAYGQPARIDMKRILDYYYASHRMRMAVELHVEEAVGHGYYITCEKEGTSAKAALKLFDDFDSDFNLNDFNRRVARDMILAGNAFMTPVKLKGKMITGLEPVPLSSIVGIYQVDGITKWYRQRTSNMGTRTIMAEDMLHFARNNVDASPWGNGIGQGYCSPGVPYKSPEGHDITPPSQAESDSFSDHMALMTQYAGLPKFLAMLPKLTPDDREKLSKELAAGQPLSSIVIEDADGKGKVETLGMQTQGKFGDQQKRIHENSILALMAPEIALWDTENVQAYASSQEVAKSILPMIIGYKAAHARFVERNVLKPIIDHAMGPNYWGELGIKLNWGQPDTRDLDSIYKAALLLQHKIMKDVVNPKDILGWLKEAGYETTPPDPALVAKREERERAMQQAMGGAAPPPAAAAQAKKQKRKDDNAEPGDGAVGVGATKPSEKVQMSADEQKQVDKAQKARAERAFYRYIENKFAVDGNVSDAERERTS